MGIRLRYGWYRPKYRLPLNFLTQFRIFLDSESKNDFRNGIYFPDIAEKYGFADASTTQNPSVKNDKMADKPTVVANGMRMHVFPLGVFENCIDMRLKMFDERIRSMPKKGCSLDKVACEGFFGRLKDEMFYGRDWEGVSLEGFMDILERYLLWYDHQRIKRFLGGLSTVAYGKSLGLY
jgi:hypothetical protein